MLDAAAFEPDPSARGLEFVDVDIAAPLGPCPAWFVRRPGRHRGDTWALLVHGRGGTRREGLRLLPMLHALDLPSLVLSYRNDPEAPASPDGHYHLGDTEWLDVEAAVATPSRTGRGGSCSSGGRWGRRSPGRCWTGRRWRRGWRRVVWDAPLLDWRATLRQQARIRRIPPALTGLTVGFTGRRIGIDFDRFDLLAVRPPCGRPP